MKARLILSLIFAAISIPALAETAYIPPNAPQVVITRTANGQDIDYRSAGSGQPSTTNFKGGSWSVNSNGHLTLKPDPHFGSTKTANGSVTATKTNPVTFTNSYGAKATGTIKTQTKAGTTSSLAKGFGVMAVGQFASSHHQNLQNQGVSDQISRGFSDGDWGAVAAGIGKVFDWSGVGGIYAQALYGNQAVQQQVIDPLHQQALAQARQDFDNYQRQAQADPNNYAQYSVLKISQDHPLNQDKTLKNVLIPNIGNGSRGWFDSERDGKRFTAHLTGSTGISHSFDYTFPEGNRFVYFDYKSATKDDIINMNAQNTPSPQDYLPTEAQLAEMMLKLLNSQSANTQAVTDLVNALWANGNLDPNNTQTAVTGSAADNTFLTAPYTPAGSSQAEQTQFKVNPDGSVTATTIPRSDLAANTSQAPTRAPVGTPTTTPSTTPSPTNPTQAPNESPKPEKPDICAANPNAIMCADMGYSDYEDIVPSNDSVNVGVTYIPYFPTKGSCPQDIELHWLGSTFKFSYAPACKIATLLNPVFQLVGMAVAASIAFAAVREL